MLELWLMKKKASKILCANLTFEMRQIKFYSKKNENEKRRLILFKCFMGVYAIAPGPWPVKSVTWL